ncbi:MAG: response regulator [Candidatus Deferrimicrobium sp.]
MAGTPKKVLVVEDNGNNLLLTKDILRHHGYEVIEAGNGHEAIRLARERNPDLILMDIQMPVMDGIAAGRILKGDPATRQIKIIAVTSFAMKGDREKILEAGFDDYIAKPLNTRELPLIVGKHLGTEEPR